MRRLLLVLFIVLLPRPALAGALLMQPPITKLVSTAGQLSEMCAVSGSYDACTQFVAYKLEASCYETDRGWALDASATFRPFIVLHNIRQVQHEQEHIGDVRQSVERFLSHLANVRFDSPGACEAAAFEGRRTFPERMSEFASASNEMHHPRAVMGGRR